MKTEKKYKIICIITVCILAISLIVNLVFGYKYIKQTWQVKIFNQGTEATLNAIVQNVQQQGFVNINTPQGQMILVQKPVKKLVEPNVP